MKTETALDAIEMARWSREKYLPELRCHSDAGSQVTSIRYGERLAEVGATPSIGSVGESYDNALAETVNGQGRAGARARETRAVEDHRRSRARDAGWVHWHDTKRLHGYLGDVPPFEYEEFFYAAVASAKELVEIK